jgi:hypothetical protein
MYVKDLCSRRHKIVCALLLLQKVAFVLSYAFQVVVKGRCSGFPIRPLFLCSYFYIVELVFFMNMHEMFAS